MQRALVASIVAFGAMLGGCGDDAGAAGDAGSLPTPDAGIAIDGGPPPSGCDRLRDAGPRDAGEETDAGALDPGAFPPARGPGGPRTTFGAEELLVRCGAMDFGDTDERHHNTGFFLDGYLVRPWAHERGRGGIAVFEFDDPCSPVRVANVLDEQIRETHAAGYSTVNGRWIVVASLRGIQFWDVSDVLAPRMVTDMVLEGTTYPDAYMRTVMSTAWQAPYVYVGGSDNGVYVVDATDPTDPRLVTRFVPEPAFRVGNVHALGNLLVVMGSENSRVALVDISVPDAPRSIPGGSFLITNGALDRFGRPVATTAYFGMIGGGYSYHARNGLGGGLAIYDIREPTTPRFVGNVDAPGADGGYVFLHEGFAFVGLSEYATIYDVRDPTAIAEVGRIDFPGDLDTVTPFGNVAMVSVDDDAEDGIATGIFPWREAPDARGPRVDWVIPAGGAEREAVTSRIGLTFDELVAMESVWRGSIQIREVGSTTPIDAWYSGQDGQVNVWPVEPLRPGTTYEVIVPAGGVHDISGNAITVEHRSTFTTESCP